MQRDRLFIEEMINAAEHARALTADVTLDQLEHDQLRRDALLWNFTVLGEAAARISEELKTRHPDVGWRRPADTRNRIIHGYWSIDLEILYTTANDQLGGLVKALRSVLDDLP
ncbi:MAG: HepT-like ribonuclease domain-containing protein [Haloechinothrix sp.]